MDSSNAYAWCVKGYALNGLDLYEEAIIACNQALNIKLGDYEALNTKGIALDNLGRCEEAITTYDQALTIQPDFHEHSKTKALPSII